MAKLSIEERWQSYARDVLPKDAPPIQRRECRMAFFAGASATFYGILDAVSADADPTAADEALMNSLDQEFKRFSASEGVGPVAAATRYDRDLLVPCTQCQALAGKPCNGLAKDFGPQVHLIRRVTALLHESGNTVDDQESIL